MKQILKSISSQQIDSEIRSGNFAIRNKVHGVEIFGKKLGLIGMGAIGSKVAEIAAHGFGIEICS